MDPLSVLGLSASIAGLLSLLKDVVDVLKNYTDGVTSAPDDAQKLLTELIPLSSVLQQLKVFLKTEEVKGNFYKTSALYSVVQFCQAQIETLYEKLIKLRRSEHKWARNLEHFKWPFKKQEFSETAETLYRCAQIFQFSLTIDNCELLSKTSAELKKQLDLMQPAAFVPQVSKLIDGVSKILDLISTFPQLEAKIDNMQSLILKTEGKLIHLVNGKHI